MSISSDVGKIVETVKVQFQGNNLDDTTTHFSLDLIELEEIIVHLIEDILDLGKHSTVTFKENLKSTKYTKGRHPKSMGTCCPRKNDRKISDKIGIAQGGKKSNISL